MDRIEKTIDIQETIHSAAALIRSARYLTAFTGAGVSVESGIPPFRGAGGLWDRYDPRTLEVEFFFRHPEQAWPVIREIFYDNFGRAKPNRAHEVLSAWEARGLLKCLITQNIDNLHYTAGSRNIVEFHGNSRLLVCLSCGARVEARPDLLKDLPPRCSCGGIYKPDFIFFGEGIPADAHAKSQEAAGRTDVMLVVGSTGEVYPAALVPRRASDAGAKIIEINPEPSEFTSAITDIHIPLKAGEAFGLLEEELHT
ncbi:MAG: Sir2 family NAD-dependent protein deacetylase [Spirochaetia bacterium]|jgi:NAD-dependent deacetylase